VPGGKVAGKLAKGARMIMKASRRVRRAGKVSKLAKRARKARRPRKRDGFKVKGKKRKKKKDKPCKKCPKNKGPGGKAVMSALPIHYGTGEELLEQTDFEIEGEIAFDWTRSYRSGSECEDWGLLGARWAIPYTASLSLSVRGIVYHEESGRALRLPPLAVGTEHDNGVEGFVLRRDSDARFTLTWRDGSTDTFEQGPDGWLPHGYDGANAMRKPQPPERVTHCFLTRSEARDGRGITIERLHEARPGEPLLRLRGDNGLLIEALRDETALDPQTPDTVQPPRIGRVEQILPDGRRICHVTYRYEAEPVAPKPAYATLPEGYEHFETLPQRCNLVEQTNIMGHSRRYAYRHHLLLQYSNYNGFSYRFSWISLAQLRERWAGSQLDAKELASLHPITLYNSYQARATVSVAEDGTDRCLIDYIDEDTSRVTEPDGGVLEYTFDENWLATEVRRIPNDGGPAQSLGRWEWDADANLTAEIDAEGNTTQHAYDKAGNLTAITNALGHTSHISYNKQNLPVFITDSLGNTRHQTYDARGNLIESHDPLGHVTRYSYDEAGRLILLTNAKGGVTKLQYDAQGQLTTITDCSDRTTGYTYEEGGGLSAVTDPLGQLTQYTYDSLGRLRQVTYPDQVSEHYAYDAEGNLTTHTNANGQVTRYRYNGQGLPIERIDAKGQTIHYRYDNTLRLVELINGNGESYSFAYDEESRLINETGFDGKITSYVYDRVGQLIASESAGARTEYQRDPLGRLLTKLTPEGHSRYAYDPLGRLIAIRCPRTEQRFTYDAAGQLIEERLLYAFEPGEPPQAFRPSAAFKLKYEYDPLGNRIRTWLPNGRVIDTLQYGSGHWYGTRWSRRSIADLERDALHRETSRQLGQAEERLTTHSDYDPQSRLSGMCLMLGRKKLHERHYRYDPEGNPTRIDVRQLGSIRYSYDPIGQLLSAVQPDLKETFAFDPAGNLVDKPEKEENQKKKTAFQQVSQESQAKNPAYVRHNRLERYHNFDYEYDIQGNAVIKRINPPLKLDNQAANESATLDLTYDQENRLIRVVKNYSLASITANYVYDAYGRRIAKNISEARWEKPEQRATAKKVASPKTTWFVWDDDRLIQEIHLDKTVTYLYEPESFIPLALIESDEGHKDYLPSAIHMPPVGDWDALENPEKCEAHVRQWWRYQVLEAERSHRIQWQRRLEKAQQDASQDRINYYHCDHLGTPQALYDDSGKMVWSAKYCAWGRIYHLEKHEIDQPLRFQGQYEDCESKLYYNRHRYYDPDSARYLSQDPIMLLGGENLYQYAPNAIAWIDPIGLSKSSYQFKSMTCCNEAIKDKERYCRDIPLLKKGGKVLDPSARHSPRRLERLTELTSQDFNNRIRGLIQCLRARQAVTRLCYNGITDQSHQNEEAAVRRGIRNTQRMKQQWQVYHPGK
jgi:RHS repeat-associated protein